MAKYFVTGATGTVGSEVVRHLLAQGQSVVAANRHTDKTKELFGNQVETTAFDFMDSSTFAQVAETDGVFLLGPPMYPDLFKMLTPFTDYLIEHGPKRIVYLSANGMDDLAELPFHAQMEEKLQASGLDWRIVQPGFFMDNFRNYEKENIEQRKIVFVPAGEGKTAFISSKDIGASVATLLMKNQYRHRTFELTGDKTYSYFEVADLLSEVMGEQIVYPNPDEATYRKVLADAGAPPMIADYMIPVYGLIKNNKVENVTNHVALLTGKAPESLRAVLVRDFGKK